MCTWYTCTYTCMYKRIHAHSIYEHIYTRINELHKKHESHTYMAEVSRFPVFQRADNTQTSTPRLTH